VPSHRSLSALDGIRKKQKNKKKTTQKQPNEKRIRAVQTPMTKAKLTTRV
jgi:hypothetical protein